MGYFRELRTEISLLMEAANLGKPYAQLYRAKERSRNQLDLLLSPKQSFVSADERDKLLLQKLSDCTIFKTFQETYENGEFTHWTGDMHEHAHFIYDLGRRIQAKNILEFGIGSGQSTLYLAAIANRANGRLISLDPRPKHAQFVKKNLKYWGLLENADLQYNQDSFSFRKLYHDKYHDIPLDMILVDSGHTYTTTQKELAMWLPLLRQGGVMIFHDIVWCFDAVQLAVDDFLRGKKVVYIKTDGWLKPQCDRCTAMGDLRPQLNKNGRPLAQSAEVFDAPKTSQARSFFDYTLVSTTHEAAAATGAQYTYEMRTNSCGIGILMKHSPYEQTYNAADSYFMSNWHEAPIDQGPTIQ